MQVLRNVKVYIGFSELPSTLKLSRLLQRWVNEIKKTSFLEKVRYIQWRTDQTAHLPIDDLSKLGFFPYKMPTVNVMP